MHPIPAVLNHVHGVSSLTALNGGYGTAYRAVNAMQRKRTACAVNETHTAKSERKHTLQTSRKRNGYG